MSPKGAAGMDMTGVAIRVLEEAGGEALHWTVIWDTALRKGYVDAFADPEARDRLLRALARAARAGRIEKTSTGTYRMRRPPPGEGR